MGRPKKDQDEKYIRNPKAGEAFRRPAYQAGKMVQEQGRQIEHKTVSEYLAEKYDIGGI